MIRVLVVDDSALVRNILSQELGQYDDIEVVGGAVDPYVARDKIVQLKPDVLTLDIEMPRMDGFSFLAKLMHHYPLPVVVVSSLTPEHSDLAIKALELGAVSVAQQAGRNAVGVLLTGMGADGAKGLLAMRESGAGTIAQDEHTSTVFGMPREAIRLGAVTKIAPLPKVASIIVQTLLYQDGQG